MSGPPPPGDQWGGPPPGYAGSYGPAYPAPVYLPPSHPSATTALVLGIVSLAGAMFCLVPIVMAPFAWVIGGRAVREIDASAGALGGRGSAQAGRVLGIVGTALMVLGILAFIAFIAFVAVVESTTGPGGMPA